MKITFWFAFLIILSVICCKADAIEVLRFERISDRDGLSQNTVRCIMQDSKGFMWLGTINGLNRYNGREFTVMLSHPEFTGRHAWLYLGAYDGEYLQLLRYAHGTFCGL